MRGALLAELFDRTFILNLGGTLVTSETTEGKARDLLRCVFKVESSLAKSANTAEITVYNLAESTRAAVSKKDIETTLDVGYTGNSSTIFRGKLEAGKNTRDGVDWITSFQCTDGGKELRSARINLSFKNINLEEATRRAVDALGVGVGNAIEKIREGNIRGAFTEYTNGVMLSGPAQRELDKLVKTAGYEWSIQSGQLQLLGPTDAIEPGDAIELDSDRGMIGSPESGEKGIVEVRSLLIPQLTPGRVVSLSSKQLSGFYRVEKVTFLGDTRGQDWYADLELKPR